MITESVAMICDYYVEVKWTIRKIDEQLKCFCCHFYYNY